MAPTSTPDKYPTKEMFDIIVDVTVGEGATAKTFMLHKGVLCFYSGYFDKALNGDWDEARKGTIILDTEDVNIFERFVFWLFTRQIENNKAKESFDALPNLWMFADRREIPLLMNACVDCMRDEIVAFWQVPTGSMNSIWSGTTPSSGLRRFVTHIIASTLSLKRDNATNPLG